MGKDTKEKLIQAALLMFSQNGYAGTNIRELSASLGLGKSSMYRHFESKEDIWNMVLDEMEAYYNEKFGSAENMPAVPQNTEELKNMAMGLFDFTIHDEKIIMTRKLLLTEQFRDERVRDLATKHFSDGLESMFTRIFEGMIENGSLKKDDPVMLAFTFTAPIGALVQLCDRVPERSKEAREKAEAFISHFISVYGA